MSTPDEPYRCPYFEPGKPACKPLPSGHLCGGIEGQPCRECVCMGLGVRGQAEFFMRTMVEPKDER